MPYVLTGRYADKECRACLYSTVVVDLEHVEAQKDRIYNPSLDSSLKKEESFFKR